MSKEEYRGQDTTLEMIRERFNKGRDWNIICKELYEEMIAEGLTITAKAILKHVRLEPNQQIIINDAGFYITNIALIGECGPELILPTH